MDKELLEKFNKINQKYQSYESSRDYQSSQSFQISQEQFSDDDEPASITSSIYSADQPAQLNSLITIKSSSSLSHSSSNASSTSEPIGKPKSSPNLRSQLIGQNGSKRNNRASYGSQPDSSQCANGPAANRSSHISLSSQNGQLDSAKSSGSISDEAADGSKENGREPADKNALFVEHDERPKSQSELSISSELNLNDSTIPSIDMSNLASLANLSNASDSNLSDPSDSNLSLPSDSNDTANGKEPEERVITNAITNIKLNPFMQQDQKTKLLYKAAKEIRDSEKTYVDVLSLICIQYKNAVRKSISQSVLDSLLQPFDTILQLNSVLLTRFNHCIKNWDRTPKIANVSCGRMEFGRIDYH